MGLRATSELTVEEALAPDCRVGHVPKDCVVDLLALDMYRASGAPIF